MGQRQSSLTCARGALHWQAVSCVAKHYNEAKRSRFALRIGRGGGCLELLTVAIRLDQLTKTTLNVFLSVVEWLHCFSCGASAPRVGPCASGRVETPSSAVVLVGFVVEPSMECDCGVETPSSAVVLVGFVVEPSMECDCD